MQLLDKAKVKVLIKLIFSEEKRNKEIQISSKKSYQIRGLLHCLKIHFNNKRVRW